MCACSQSAIVLGASMSGLLAAKALGSHFQRVTVVERDLLPDGAALRRGVPQCAHAHGLLASGYRVVNDYFPGIMDELEALGARPGCRRGFSLVSVTAVGSYGISAAFPESVLAALVWRQPCVVE